MATARKSTESADPPAFQEGDRVKIVGLKSLSALNGCRGVLESFSADSGRWAVQTEVDERVAVRPQNLVREEDWKNRTCENCSINQPHDAPRYKLCAGCCLVYYCNETCQRQHWKTHKPTCQQNQAGIRAMEEKAMATGGATMVWLTRVFAEWRNIVKYRGLWPLLGMVLISPEKAAKEFVHVFVVPRFDGGNGDLQASDVGFTIIRCIVRGVKTDTDKEMMHFVQTAVPPAAAQPGDYQVAVCLNMVTSGPESSSPTMADGIIMPYTLSRRHARLKSLRPVKQIQDEINQCVVPQSVAAKLHPKVSK